MNPGGFTLRMCIWVTQKLESHLCRVEGVGSRVYTPGEAHLEYQKDVGAEVMTPWPDCQRFF